MKKKWNFSNNVSESKQKINISDIVSSVILIDSNQIDNFINTKLLEHYSVTDICAFSNIKDALSYLKETNTMYQLILVGLYMPMAGGFEFIDKFRALELQQKHGKIILLSAFFSPEDIEMAERKSIKLINKPLTVNELLLNM